MGAVALDACQQLSSGRARIDGLSRADQQPLGCQKRLNLRARLLHMASAHCPRPLSWLASCGQPEGGWQARHAVRMRVAGASSALPHKRSCDRRKVSNFQPLPPQDRQGVA